MCSTSCVSNGQLCNSWLATDRLVSRRAGRRLKAEPTLVDTVASASSVYDFLFEVVAAAVDGDQHVPWEAAWELLMRLPTCESLKNDSDDSLRALPGGASWDGLLLIRAAYLVQLVLAR